jgi:2-C-methyl-D-erythritol 4-phosphate cytidylyltransferase
VTTVAVLLAAGAGRRLGWAIPKAFVPLAGRPMVEYSLMAMAESGAIDEVVLVVPPSEQRRVRALLADRKEELLVASVVAGGDTRQASVRCGLQAVSAKADRVVCHDAARPFATAGLFASVARALSGVEGAIPVVPPPDTVKRIQGGRVVETIPRDELALTQTPQAFVAEALRAAHDRAMAEGRLATDDATLLEAAGYRVAVVEGEPSNFKVTTPEDLARAEEIAERSRKDEADRHGHA